MPANIHILSAGAVKPGLVKVIEAYRDDVNVEFATAPAIAKRISAGEAVDIVIAPHNLIDEIAASSSARATIGRIGVGILVRAGAAQPHIETVEVLKDALVKADSLVFNQASTGLYLEKLFDQQGIAAQVASKSIRHADFAAVLKHISSGHGNEIGFGATTVIIENAGAAIHYVGPLPAEIQNYTTYAAALIAKENEAARNFLDFLATAQAKAIFSAAGIQ